MSYNALTNPNRILVGQVLRLPGSSAPSGGAQFHVVQADETISGLASRYGISQQQLIDANGLTGGMIYVGQRLSLVPVAAAAPAAAGGVRHTVTAGETLSSIAQHFGTTIRAIQAANSIDDPDRVLVGQSLAIPSGAGGASVLRCPVQGTMHHMNDWGFPRSGGRFHEGNDLFADRGTPAVAVVGGTAVQADGPIGGHQVKLVGDDGVTYYYSHLDRFGAAGRVAAGTVIGYVGKHGQRRGRCAPRALRGAPRWRPRREPVSPARTRLLTPRAQVGRFLPITRTR